MNQNIDIQVKKTSLSEALFSNQVAYTIDYYQRHYAWGDKEVDEMMDDLYTKFNESYPDSSNIKKNISTYKEYHLGNYLLSRKNNIDYIIDGQQRLTTLTLLFMVISHLSTESNDYHTAIRAMDHVCSKNDDDEIEFKIIVSSRKNIMLMLHNQEENISSEDESCVLLVKNYRRICNYIEANIEKEKLPVFFRWLCARVFMVNTTTYDDAEAYTMFETMNDRGKTLSKIDKLKGYLLSMIPESKIKEASDLWRDMEKSFKNPTEFDTFVIELFRAKWAKTTPSNDRTRNSGKNDWTEIHKHYHRFIKDNRKEINLDTGESVLELIREMKAYSELDLRIKKYKENYDKEFKDLYKISQFDLPFMNVLLFGIIQPNDKDENIKIQIITKFLDITIGYASWMKSVKLAEAGMIHSVVSILKRLRSTDMYTDYNVLAWFFYNEIINKSKISIDNVQTPKLTQKPQAKKQIKYMLANFADFLEDDKNRNVFAEFYDTKDKYEIEHMLASNFEHNSAWYNSEEDLSLVRDNIGALGLLRKSINSSLNNMSYVDKISKYIEENTYLASLSKSFYKKDGKIANKPSLNRVLNENPEIEKRLKAYEKMDSDSVKERDRFCLEMHKIIWNKEVFHKFINSNVFENMDDVKELMDGVFPADEDDETDDGIHSVGDKLSYCYQDTKIEGIYEGNGKVQITKIDNAPTKDAYSKSAQENFDYFKVMYPMIIKDAEIDVINSKYNWKGSLSQCPLKSIINLARGQKTGGSVKISDIVNESK